MKVVVEDQCEDLAPFMFERQAHSPALVTYSGNYYNFYTKGSSSWPHSDPCGANQQRHLTGVVNPRGWMFARDREFNADVKEVFNENDSK